MKFTAEQQRAIDIRGRDVLVSAGAGSGKTAVLVERIISMITGPCPVNVDRLLVVTFTDAAATEMRQRVSTALNKCINQNPQDENLKKQLALLGKSNITTIHSFCLRVARRFFHKIDMDPGFRVADGTEINLLKTEILDGLFEEYYQGYYDEGKNPEFVRLAGIFDQRVSDDNFRRLVLDLHEFSRSCPDPAGWLTDKAAEYALPGGIEATGWYEFFAEDSSHILQSVSEDLKKALKLAQNPNIHEKYRDVLAADLDNAERALLGLGQGFADFCDAMEFTFDSLPSAKSKTLDGTMDKEEIDGLKGEIQGLRDGFKKGVGEIRAAIIKRPDLMEQDLQYNHENMATLTGLVLEFSCRFQDAKREKNLADFADFEHFCLEILFEGGYRAESPVLSAEAFAIQSEFDEIFIDEYQDLSLIQEVILGALSGKEKPLAAQNRFMVGDIKQCIYQFRNARPEIFAAKAKGFYEDETKGSLIGLAENFRSRGDVIDTVNFLFEQLMSERVGGLDYDRRAFLHQGADYAENGDFSTVFHLVDGAEVEEEEEDTDERDILKELSSAQIEARIVARHIKELVENKFQIHDKNGGLRDICLRDIVILMRSSTNAQIFADELKNLDIPSFSGSDEDYFLATEVMTVLALLQIIDNPRQDIPLITVLHSAIFRFSPDELVAIRKALPTRGEFFGALTAFVQTLDDADETLRIKARDFLDRLEKWRNQARFLSVSQLIFHLYQETGFYDYVGILPGGKIRMANLMLLLEKAAKYEETSYHGLFNFIRYIEKLQKNNFGFETASVASENEDLVRIMTIHKSKGLEFPVVFMCNLGKRFNLRDSSGDFVMEYDLGMGMKAVDLEAGVVSNTFSRHVIGKRINQLQISEEMRVFYVALTRAREKLYLIGSVRDLTKAAKYSGAPRPYDVMRGRSFLDWILMALGGLDRQRGWDIRISNKGEFWQEERRRQTAFGRLFADMVQASTDEERREEVFRRLSYVYPHQAALHAPAKMSVSEVKRLYYREFLGDSVDLEQDFEFGKKDFPGPKFLQKGPANAASRGIATHTVLEHIDLYKVTKADIVMLIEQLTAKGLLTPEEAAIVHTESLVRFLASDVAGRMRKSSKVRREIPFTVAVPPGLINASLAEDAQDDMILHGVVDCAFEEEDGLVIVDYKTEGLRAHDNPTAIGEAHRPQMELYQYALEKVFGVKVKQRIVYFFDRDLAVDI